ncbi:GRAM domain-containing protein 1B [Fopius arisanus]|uniref:GRAM domain-containing protein 1B n=1 Tax=Fopius arisanus TaxID=64838 RepID=A0A9R1TVA2_9HYME|nr:PREDICTED: GRAM domain-containing protein 1B-like [Fopius arisanus]
MYGEKETLSDHPISNMNKSVENLLVSSTEVLSSINSSSMGGTKSHDHEDDCRHDNPGRNSDLERNHMPSPNASPQPSPKNTKSKKFPWKSQVSSSGKSGGNEPTDGSTKTDDQTETTKGSSDSTEHIRPSSEVRKSERSKKKSSWYNVLYPTYKSRSEDFKRIFKDVPDDERLVVDYSCALQREILVHGRLYVSQNYVCFYANIFMWETVVSLRWKDVVSITKEKTALVIPNAISICTETDKFFLTTFGARDKTYMMLFKIWQNALIGQPMSNGEMWSLVHTCYGEELGLTSDDEDYISPSAQEEEKIPSRLSMDSFSEPEPPTPEPVTTPCVPTSLPVELNPDPTDQSDTTESDAEKQNLRLGVRSPTTCTSTHDGRELINTTLPIHIDQLFTLLFTTSKFFLDFHTARKTTDLIQSEWTQHSETNKKMRTVSLTVSLTQPVGPRKSQVTETQIMLPCSRPGHRYCIDIETNNAGIPYADSFSVFTHFCIAFVSESETSLQIFSEIKFKKHVWAVMRALIDKNCWAGLEEYFGSLVKALSVECEETSAGNGIKRKTRRRRRGVGASTHQPHPPDLLPLNLAPPGLELPTSVVKPREETISIVNWILLIAVLCLMVINGLLYYKLWGLEDAAAYTVMDLHVLRKIPKSEEDWVQLLQQQESLHNVEMRRWQRILQTAAQLLKQTEESLTELQRSMHPMATEKMFSVLKPHLKGFSGGEGTRGQRDEV